MRVCLREGKIYLDEASLSSLLTIILLIGLHAWLVFSYAVLTNLRHTPLRERSEAGDRRARSALKLYDDLPRLHITNQIVLMLVRFVIVAVVVVLIAVPLVETPDGIELFRIPLVGYAVVLIPAALLTYIFGELVPSAFGNAYADRAAGLVTGIMRSLVFVLGPLVSLLLRLSATLARFSGGETMGKAVTEEEIMSLVDVGQKGGTIEDEEKEMIYSVLQFGETLAREVMVPRPDITGIEIDAPLEEALKRFIESGHSRIPVYEEDMDDVKGLLYAKDLLNLWYNGDAKQATIRALMRPAYFVPETKRADMLFKEMQERKIHLAIVVDEYGGTAGLVTIEDLVEEIVGDIKDEYDLNEEAEYIQLGPNEYIVDGSMNLDDLNELLDIELPTDENDSIGGYIYSLLGHVPDVGETITDEERLLQMRIEAVESRRIRKVHLLRLQPAEENEDEEGAASDAAADSNGKRGRRRGRPSLDNPEVQPRAASS
jgi:putative hemolysin